MSDGLYMRVKSKGALVIHQRRQARPKGACLPVLCLLEEIESLLVFSGQGWSISPVFFWRPRLPLDQMTKKVRALTVVRKRGSLNHRLPGIL